MAKKEKVPNEAKAQKPLYKKWWFWVIVVSLVGAAGSGIAGGGKSAEPDTSRPPVQTETQAPALASSEPVKTPEASPAPAETTPGPEIPSAPLDLEALSANILAAIPETYQGSDWNNVTCDESIDGSVFVILQVDQRSNDTDAALALASECYEIAKGKVEAAGVSLDSVSATIVNDGAALGVYATDNGEKFTLISDGKRTEVTLP